MKFMIDYGQVSRMLRYSKMFMANNRIFFAYRGGDVLFEVGDKDYYFRSVIDHSIVGGRSKNDHIVALDYRLFCDVFRLVKPASGRILLEFPRKDGLVAVGDVQLKTVKGPVFPHIALRSMFEEKRPFRLMDFPLRAVSQVASAANSSSMSSRSVVCLDFLRGNTFGTDGHRLHIVNGAFKPWKAKALRDVRLPPKIVNYMRQFGNNGGVFTPAAHRDESCSYSIIYHDGWTLIFREATGGFSSRIIDDYDHVFSEEEDIAMVWTFEASKVIGALNKCVALTDTSRNCVCLRIDGGNVTLGINNDRRGKYCIDLSRCSSINPIKTDSVHVHLNPSYLRDLLYSARANGKRKELSLRIPAASMDLKGPLEILTDNGFRGGLMPMRFDKCDLEVEK